MACSEDCGRKKEGDRLIKGNNQSKSKKKTYSAMNAKKMGI
jgi:hypothetical protein